jgi:hypothetical protein
MTAFMTGADLISMAEGLISAKKQQGAFSLDLTVSSVSQVKSGGSLDFGGSEFHKADLEPITPEKKSPDEPYGWWKLVSGRYLLKFNERLKPSKETVIMILPHERLVAAGGVHPPLLVEELDENLCVLLLVGPEGLSIKENARVSKAVATG